MAGNDAHSEVTRAPNSPENRRFGIGAALFLMLFYLAQAWRRAEIPAPWPVAAAIPFLLVAWLRADWLATPRRVWIAFGEVAGKITQPVVLRVIYYFLIVPFGCLR